MSPIKILTWALLIAGLAVATALIAWQGADEIAALHAEGAVAGAQPAESATAQAAD